MRGPTPTGLRDVSRTTSFVLRLLVLRFPMPIHPHFADLSVSRFAEHGATGVDPVAAAAPAIGAPELGGEPGARRVDLACPERHLRLVDGDVLPVGADRGAADAALAERTL